MTGEGNGASRGSGGVGPAPRRGTWLDRSTDTFLDELHQLGLVVTRAQAASHIRGRLAWVSAALRVTEQSARRYVDDEVLRDLARSAAMELAEERPGVSLVGEERNIPVPMAILGRVIAGLAEAAHLRSENGDAAGVGTVMGIVSAIGLILEDECAGLPNSILLPQAALARCARLLAVTGEMVRGGATRDDLASEVNAGLPQAFDRDVQVLRGLLDEYGSPGGPSPGS